MTLRKSLRSVLLMSMVIVLLLSAGALAVGTATITGYNNSTNTLTWSEATNATDYYVWIYDTDAPAVTVWDALLTAPATSVVTTELASGNEYVATVAAYDSFSETGSVSAEFFFDTTPDSVAPSIVTDGSGSLTGFQWVASVAPGDIDSFIIEITGANGLEYEVTVPGTITSLTFDPDTWWPTGNVYSSYRARVKEIYTDTTESSWSEYSVEGTFPLPQITTYSYQILRLPWETSIASDAVIKDREILVRWDRLSSFPGTFINWDPDKVTWELEVYGYEIGTPPPSLPTYSAKLPNQESKVAHVVSVGEEGKYMRYSFFFRPFYDGEPLYTGTTYNGMLMRGFYVDLKGPSAVTMVDSPDNPSAYNASWVFDWNEAAETDSATAYELLIQRLEGATSAVNAEVRIPVTNAELPLTVIPRDHFDKFYGQRFRYSVTPYDAIGNAGVAVNGTFEVSYPTLNATMATFTSTASTATVTWDNVAGAASYELEVSGENGTHTWTGITVNSQSFSWATVFPASNVYRTWHARVRAIDDEGNVGAWSTDITYPLTMPMLSPIDFDILRVDTLTDAPQNTRIADRQLLARWPVISSGSVPLDFINFDANRVTFDFQVDAVSLNNSIGTSWLYTITANTWPCGQLVDVGVEGDEMTYIFYLQPLYDGVPMIGSWQFSSSYVIDLKGPSAVSITDYPDDPTLFDDPWVFDWNAAPDPDPAIRYELLIERLEGTASSVDAAVELSVAEAALPITIQPREHFDTLYGRRFRFTVTPYDAAGNAGAAVTNVFTLDAPALAATMATFTSTASTATVTWNSITEAASYELEVSGENGTHTWTGLTGSSQSFNWATVFPAANVYKTWHARVRGTAG